MEEEDLHLEEEEEEDPVRWRGRRRSEDRPSNTIPSRSDRTTKGSKTNGTTRQVFDGDRTKTEGFVDSLGPTTDLTTKSPLPIIRNKNRPTLTLIQGPGREWARQKGRWLDERDPVTEDTHWTLGTSLSRSLKASFDDTQKLPKARNQLDRLVAKWPEVDQYTMDFEKLTREANYRIGSPESIQMYLKGLPDDVAADVLGPPLVHDYPSIKERAQSVSTRRTLKALRDLKRGTPARSRLAKVRKRQTPPEQPREPPQPT